MSHPHRNPVPSITESAQHLRQPPSARVNAAWNILNFYAHSTTRMDGVLTAASHAFVTTPLEQSEWSLLNSVLRDHTQRDSLLVRLIGEPLLARVLADQCAAARPSDQRLYAITSQAAHMLSGSQGPDPLWWQNLPATTAYNASTSETAGTSHTGTADRMLDTLLELTMTCTPARLIAIYQAIQYDIESDLDILDLDWELSSGEMLRSIMLASDD